ncbi:transposable element Tc1 transposase [Trichonephila clavipes]|nr:transposable element Tc1 transposase [Trichonephila clavipes]
MYSSEKNRQNEKEETPPAIHACIARTSLVFIRVTLTAQRCVDDILRTALLLLLLLYPGLIFQQDKARPHKACVCVAMNCLTACQILTWTARSPDLSPIDHA